MKWALFAAMASLVTGCTGSEQVVDDPPTAPEETGLTYPLVDCDPLVPEFCGFPFPSNVYTVDDPSTPTGRRVSFGKGLLQGNDSGPWDDSDGFSPGTPILTQLMGAVSTGLASSTNLAASLDDDALTLVLDAETGEKIPHFAEVDVRAPSVEERSFQIRPVVRLENDRRYIVAIRGVVDETGTVIEPSPAFAALRDDTAFDDESIEGRRGLYEDLFAQIEAAGWAREELQQAWDFSTASDENNTAWLLHMRDEAMAQVGSGPDYTIDTVDTDFDPDNIAFRIQGTVQVPLYMTTDGANSVLLFGEDGLPEINAETPLAAVPFEVLIPQSALKSPAPILQYGHGLFGSRTQIESEHFRTFINTYNYVIFGVDLQGMSSDDQTAVGATLYLSDFAGLRTMFDRLHQGFLNSLVSMRMMKTSFAADATYGAYINGDEGYYLGISQGGISGSVYLALSQDVERGALGVTGQPYSLLLMRSVDFDRFLDIIAVTWSDLRQQQLLVALTQMPWDRVEPTGYSHHVTADPLPGSSPKEVLMRVAIGDHQVPTLGGHIMARTMNVPHLTTNLRDIYGLTQVTETSSGSFYTEYAFGLPEVPDCGVPMYLCEDPHSKVRRLDEARLQLDEFFRLGTGTNYCPDGTCEFPDASGCEAGEDAAAAEAFCEL
ncbi:MAG: hypothetical protein AAGA48_25750 [Myxococcota bacterium]